MPKHLKVAGDQAVEIAFGGMFSKADHKLADKLRRQGRIKEAEAAERRIRLRRRSVKERT